MKNEILTNFIENRFVKFILCVVGVIAVFSGIVLLYKVTGMNYDQYSQKMEIFSGWTVSYADQTYSDVELRTFRLERILTKGQKVSFSRKLPDTSRYVSPVLVVETHNTVIAAVIDGETAYHYGQERYAKNQLVGSGFHIIELPADGQSHTITLEFTATGDSHIAKINELHITDYSSVYTELLTRCRLGYVISIFLIFVGFILMLVGFVMGVTRTWFFRLVWLGMFSLSVGTWTMCSYNILQVYAVPMYMCTLIEYSALYIGPIPLLLFFREYAADCGKAYMYKLYKILFAVDMGIAMLLFVLHFTGVVHLPKFITLEHIMIVVVSVYLTVLMALRIHAGKRPDKLIIMGFLVLIVCITLELSNYVIQKYAGGNFKVYTGIAAIGTTFFIGVLLGLFAGILLGKWLMQRKRRFCIRWHIRIF